MTKNSNTLYTYMYEIKVYVHKINFKIEAIISVRGLGYGSTFKSPNYNNIE